MDVIVEATGKPTDAVWLRAFSSPVCSDIGLDYITALGAIYYENASTIAIPTTNMTVTQKRLDLCDQGPLGVQVPMYVQTPDPKSLRHLHHRLLACQQPHEQRVVHERHLKSALTKSRPQFLGAKAGNVTFPETEKVHNFGTNVSVRLVVVQPLHVRLALHPPAQPQLLRPR